MNQKLIFIIAVILIFVGSIVYVSLNSPKPDTFLSNHNLEDMSIQEIVSYLEDKLDESDDFSAAITGTKLILSDATERIELALPQNQFYLSFAPYISQTHPCANHNLVTCRGELKNETFEVRVTNLENNTVFFEGVITSSSNGFAGIWLQKNKQYEITVTYGDLSATSTFTTSDTSNTCLTTLKLNA